MGKENQKSINWQAHAIPKVIDPCMLWAACALVTKAPESSSEVILGELQSFSK